MFEECVEHQRVATAGTNLQSVMTVFRAKRSDERWGPRIWNAQVVRFACWTMPDGSTVGDPANKEITERILKHFPDWKGPEIKTAFDVLPLIIEVPGQPPELFEVPPEASILVNISHPDVDISSLGWKWCAGKCSMHSSELVMVILKAAPRQNESRNRIPLIRLLFSILLSSNNFARRMIESEGMVYVC
jgi:nitric oxide synthase oxygenase domain/subunit